MIRIFGLLMVLALALSSCMPSIYVVLQGEQAKEELENAYARKFIHLNQQLATPETLEVVTAIMNSRRWKQLDAYQQAFNAKDWTFLMGVKHLLSNKHETALTYFEQLPEDAYACQVMMCKIDCMYALQDASVNYKSAYQKALDCTNDPVVKELILIRYRFVRYER